jgi:SSS family solute:Na+ symporter
LRLAIFGVALFIFFFSLLFKQQEYILMFLAVTGAIFAGGSGSIIIGGIYWKRGTTAAAWAAMITGSSIAVAGIVIPNYYPDFLNGQIFWFIAMTSAITVYILVSLLGKRQIYDMEKLLHRGKYVVKEEYKIIDDVPAKGLKMLGMGKEFTLGDKVIYILSYTWTLTWTAVFIVGTIYALIYGIPDLTWMNFWWYYVGLLLVISLIVSVWFTIGGIKDLRSMITRLRILKRDHSDDGRIVKEK